MIELNTPVLDELEVIATNWLNFNYFKLLVPVTAARRLPDSSKLRQKLAGGEI